jgi:DNA-binding transcriptional regulator LsrR (DeoR family)
MPKSKTAHGDGAQPSEARIRMVACALLRSQGYNQEDIAERMNLSQPVVSRIVTAAIQARLLQAQPTFLPQNASPAEIKQAQRRYAGKHSDLEQKIRTLVPRGLCFRLHTVAAKDLHAFCEQAARHVAGLLTGDLIVGTMWGSAIERIIDGVTRYAQPSKRSELRAIPLAGDPLFLLNQENQEYSASALAAKLERAFTGRTRSDLPSLNGVPAYISRSRMADRKKAAGLMDFIQSIPGYHLIFGSIGYERQVNTVLTGVGVFASSPQQTTATFIREREAQEGPEFAPLRQLILGDFAGSILPKPGLRPAQNDLVAGLNLGWLGISLSQLKRVAREAKTTSPPGVITVAFASDNKAAIVRESLRRGLINHLVVDDDLAQQLAAQGISG